MNWKAFSLTIVVLLSLFVISPFRASGEENSGEKGPRLDELIVYLYENETACYAALKTGEIDYMAWRLSPEQFEDAMADPNIVVGAQKRFIMFEFDLNNNYTMTSRPDHRSPTNDLSFRRALCYLTDKDYIVGEILGAFGERIDVPISTPQSDWWNPNVTGTNYPYEFNITQAQVVLDEGGWEDTDNDGTRNYPEGWEGKPERPNIDPIIFMARSDDPLRSSAAEHLRDNMEAVGIPVNLTITTYATCVWEVMYQKNYHIYTGGWNLWRYSFYIYFLYNSAHWSPSGELTPNYVTGMNGSNDPNYPLFDEALADIYYSESLQDYSQALMLVQEMYVENAISIPLWTLIEHQAWRSDLLGVVNMQYIGLENIYTFMNAYHANSSNIQFKMGVVKRHARPEVWLNAIWSEGFEIQCLDRIIEFGRTMLPYDVYTDEPWIIKDWEVGTWDGGTKTKQTLWLNENVTYVSPVTGGHFSNLTAEDFFFTVWMYNAFDDGDRISLATENIDHVVVLDDHCVEIYYSDLDYWFLYEFVPYCLPRKAWDREDGFVGYNGRVYADWPITDRLSESYVVGGPELPETPGLLNTTMKPVWVENITAGGSPLERFTDWNIVQRDGRPYIYIYSGITAGTIVSLNYSVAQDTYGTYPGGCDWEDILVGNGMWYVTEIGSDWIKYMANREYFVKAPLNIVVETPVEDQLAVIEGNITISQASVTKNTIRFDVSGPTGSTGWINVTFPAINTSRISVFVDKEKLRPPPFPIITANGTHYFIYFEFILSEHTVTIEFAQYVLGDINWDRIVDIVDIVICAMAFGSASEDNPETPWNETLKWNPNADLNQDEIIDIVDLVIVAISFGETW